MKIFVIKNLVFNAELLVIANCSAEEANKHLKKIKSKNFVEGGESIAGQLVALKDYYNCIYLKKLDLDVLVHELYHYVGTLCCRKGLELITTFGRGESGSEIGAYLMQFYFNEISKKLKKR
jgi:hypothetical protein